MKLNEEVMKKIMVNEIIKTLGVHVNSQIEWNDECECVKKKM